MKIYEKQTMFYEKVIKKRSQGRSHSSRGWKAVSAAPRHRYVSRHSNVAQQVHAAVYS